MVKKVFQHGADKLPAVETRCSVSDWHEKLKLQLSASGRQPFENETPILYEILGCKRNNAIMMLFFKNWKGRNSPTICR